MCVSEHPDVDPLATETDTALLMTVVPDDWKQSDPDDGSGLGEMMAFQWGIRSVRDRFGTTRSAAHTFPALFD